MKAYTTHTSRCPRCCLDPLSLCSEGSRLLEASVEADMNGEPAGEDTIITAEEYAELEESNNEPEY